LRRTSKSGYRELRSIVSDFVHTIVENEVLGNARRAFFILTLWNAKIFKKTHIFPEKIHMKAHYWEIIMKYIVGPAIQGCR
jgi:hypothetical protein